MRRRVYKGFAPASETVRQMMEWAMIDRFPIPLWRECKRYHGADCKPVKSTVIISDTEITARKG